MKSSIITSKVQRGYMFFAHHSFIPAMLSFVVPTMLFFSGCSSKCSDCIEALKDLEMPQEDNSIQCLYFGDFNKFIYEPIYSLTCPDTLHIKSEALQNKGMAGLTFVNEKIVEKGAIFYALTLCKAEPVPSFVQENHLEKYICRLLH